MKTYDLTVCGETYALRLTLGGQKKLKAKFNESADDTIIAAITDAEKMAAVLDEALHFAGNENPKDVNGENLFDSLVDDGFGGQEDFANILLNIAEASGILSAKQKEISLSKIRKILEGIYEEAEAEKPANPT